MKMKRTQCESEYIYIQKRERKRFEKKKVFGKLSNSRLQLQR